MKKTLSSLLLLGFCLLIVCSAVKAQNNPCSQPKIVQSLPYSYSGSTCGNATMRNLCGYSNKNASGEVFRINVPNNVSCLRAELFNFSGNINDRHFVYLMDDCPLSNPNANCIYNNSFLGNTGMNRCPTQNMDVTPGETYYFVLATQIYNQPGGEGQPPTPIDCGNFSIEITEDPDCPVYNDNCAMEEITSLPFTSSNNTCDGKSMLSLLEDRVCFPGFGTDGHEYVYHYRNDTEDICATFYLEDLNTANTIFGTLSNFCRTQPFTQGQQCLANFTDSLSFTLLRQTDYYLYVHNNADDDFCDAFSLNVIGSGVDEMSCATAISMTTPYYLDTNSFACKDYPNPIVATCPVEDNKNYYSFSITEKSCLQVGYDLITGDFFGNREVRVFKGCPEAPGSICIERNIADYQSNQNDFDFFAKFQLEDPGDYFLLISDNSEDVTYRIECVLDSKADSLDQGTCAFPYQNPLGQGDFNETIYFDPCTDIDIIKKHENQCGADLDGATKFLEFTAPNNTCYVFTVADTAYLNAIGLFDRCPTDDAAVCLKSAQAYNLDNHQVGDLTDSLSFSINLNAGQTVYLAILGNEFVQSIYSMEARIKEIKPDACFECEEDICKTCSGIATETSEITGWRSYAGTFQNPAQTETTISQSINTNSFESRHQVTSAGSLDKNAPIPVNNPFTGRYSIRLGNDRPNAEGEQMEFTYTVGPNSTFFTYYYAVVFEDPGHTPEEQPYFRVRVLTEDGTEIGCGVYEVSAGAGIPGFQNSGRNVYNEYEDVIYKDWEAVSIPVSAYIGEELTVEFITRDCSRGDHYGYAYFDATCEALGNLNDEIILCEGDSVALVAPPGFETYTWDNGKTGQIIYTDVPGNFHVDMVTRTGCEFAEDAVVVQEDNPVINGITVDQPCNADYIDFSLNDQNVTPPNDVSVYWIINHQDTIPDSLSWRYRGAYGRYHFSFNYDVPNRCIFGWEDSVFFYPPLAPVAAIADTFYCQGDSVRIEVPQQDLTTYIWDNGSTSHFSYYKTTGDHYVLRSAGACEDSIPFKITDRLNYPFTLPEDTSICWYDSLEIGPDPAPQTTYLWSTSDTQSKITTPDSGLYFLESNTNGCINRDSIVISYRRQSFVQLPDDTSLCFGDSILIGFADSKTHQWNTGATSDSIWVGLEGDFALTLTDGFCTEVDSIFIDTLTPPIFDLGPNIGICDLDSAALFVDDFNTPQFSRIWSTGENTDTIYAKVADTYLLTISDGQCAWTDSVMVSTDQTPVFNLPPTASYCQDSSVTLTINNSFGSVLWSTGTTGQSEVFNLPGNYWVDVTNGVCTNSDTVSISEQTRPTLFLGADTAVCETQTFTILATTNSNSTNFVWNDGSTAYPRTVQQPSAGYTLTLTDASCIVADHINLDFLPPPSSAMVDQATYCTNDSVLLDPGLSHPYQFLWNTGSTQPSIYAKTAGPYSVQIAIGNCRITDQATILEQVPLPYSLGPDQTICETDLITFGSNYSASASYLWNTGATTPTIAVNQVGTYSIEIQDFFCTIRDTVELMVNENPIFDTISFDREICIGDQSIVELVCTNCDFTPSLDQRFFGIYAIGDSIQYEAVAFNGCVVEGNYFVSRKLDCPYDIFVPNAFTPDGDGKNEVFIPVLNTIAVVEYEFRILNRWGEQIYYTENATEGWNGRYKGSRVRNGVYVWQVDVLFRGDTERRTVRGTVLANH